MNKKKLLSMLLLSTVILGQVAPVMAQTQDMTNPLETELVTESPEADSSEIEDNPSLAETEIPREDLSEIENLPLTEALEPELAFVAPTIRQDTPSATRLETGDWQGITYRFQTDSGHLEITGGTFNDGAEILELAHNEFGDIASIKTIAFTGQVNAAVNSNHLFWGLTALTSIDFGSNGENFNTSNIRTMEGMFQDLHSLTTLDLSGFDLRHVTSRLHLFSNTKLTSLTLGPHTDISQPSSQYPTSLHETNWEGQGQGTVKSTAELLESSARGEAAGTWFDTSQYFAGGTGTAEDPYLVATAQHLNNMRQYLNAHYRMVNDITLSSFSSWIPIGTDANRFTGHFDGQGYTIRDMNIEAGAANHQGLFGATLYGSLSNIVITNGKITGSGNSYGLLVGITGGSETVISNVHVSGTVSGSRFMGGLVGAVVSGEISGSSAQVAVSGTGGRTGGLAGVSYGRITTSHASGEVKGIYEVGGLVGMSRAELSSSYATGNVTGEGENVGGLAGRLLSGSIRDSYATGSVQGNQNVGGLAGNAGRIAHHTGYIFNSFALNSSVSGSSNVNAIAGVRNGTLENNYRWQGLRLNGQTPTGGAHNDLLGVSLSASQLRTQETWSNNSWNFGTDTWQWDAIRCFPHLGRAGEEDTLPSVALGETLKPVTYAGSNTRVPIAEAFTFFGSASEARDYDIVVYPQDQPTQTQSVQIDGSDLVLPLTSVGTFVIRATSKARSGQQWEVATVQVTPKPVTLSGAIHLSRPWTGNNSFTITSEDLSNVTLPAILAQDVDHAQLNLIGMTGTSPSSNVGEGSFTPTTPIALTGSRAGNYSLEIDSEFAITTEILQPQENLIDGFEQRQNYQGQKIEVPIATLFDFEAPVRLEDLEFSLEGDNLEVVGENIILEEANVGNYAIKAHHQPTGQEATGTFIIEKAQLELDRQGAIAPRPFDGTTAVNVTTAPTLKGFAQGEGGTVQLDNLRYTSADADTDTIELDGWSLDWASGTNRNNYLLPSITEANAFFTQVGGITRAQGASLKVVQESSLILEARVRAELVDDASQLHQDFWTDEIRPAVLYSLYAENPEEHPDTPVITSNKTGLFTNLRPATTYFIRAIAGETTNFEAGQSSELLQVQTDEVQVTHDFGTPQPVLRSELQDLTGSALQDKLLELLDWDPTKASAIEIGGEAIDPEKYEVRLQLVETLTAPGNFSVELTFEGRGPVFSKTIILDNFRAVDVRLAGTPILASLSELTEWREGASLEDLNPYVWAELDEGQGFKGRHEVRVTSVEDDGKIHAQFSNESLSAQLAIEDLLIQAYEDANISKNRQHKVLLADEHLSLELGSNAHTNLTKETLADQVKLWKIDPSASEGFSEVTGDEKREGIDFDSEQIQALLEADEAGKHHMNFSFGDTLETRGTATRQGSGQLAVELLKVQTSNVGGNNQNETDEQNEGEGQISDKVNQDLPSTGDIASSAGFLGLGTIVVGLLLRKKKD